MSTLDEYRDQLDEYRNRITNDPMGLLKEHYHIPSLVVLVAFMFWVRAQSWKRFYREGEVMFAGNDPYYHYRMVLYTVRHWPWTMNFDPWTGYPVGISVGQFGTLYDQIVATVALILGLGSPSDRLVATVLLFSPAVFGALTAVPIYFISRRLTSRRGGLLAVVVLSLLSGTFLKRGLVGFADHNIVETFFMAFAVVGFMRVIRKSREESIFFDDIYNKNMESIRSVGREAVIAGIAVSLYMWVWPPGFLIVGVFTIFLTLSAIVAHLQEDLVEPVMIGGAMSMVVTSVMMLLGMLIYRDGIHLSFSPTRIGWLHLFGPLLVALGALSLAAVDWSFNVKWSDKPIPRVVYPVAIGGVGIAGAWAVSQIAPHLFRMVYANAMRVVGFGTSAATRTIAEAQPFLSRYPGVVAALKSEYDLAYFFAVLGGLLVFYQSLKEKSHEGLLIIVWFGLMTSAAFTQIRFNYYLALPVAVLSAYSLWWPFEAGDVKGIATIGNFKIHHVVVVVVVASLLVPSLVVPLNQSSIEAGERTGVGSFRVWDESLDWMRKNTPKPNLQYFGTFPQVQNYDYPTGAYGVMSWWDYGHWITVEAHRIPFANPFQQNAQEAARWLLAQNETEAHQVIESFPGNDEDIRYVMIDWMMVSVQSKFGAPVIFHPDYTINEMITPVYIRKNRQYRLFVFERSMKYYRSMMVRLYYYHGSAVTPAPVVLTTKTRTFRGKSVTIATGKGLKRFRSLEAAKKYAQTHKGAHVGGFGVVPPERIKALEHFRLVHVNPVSSLRSSHRQKILRQRKLGVPVRYLINTPQWVKTFERVPGATIRGHGPPNSTVVARVQLRMTTINKTFTYKQFAKTGPDGDFTMTVPYSTTGYGSKPSYTDVSVVATGPYHFVVTKTERKEVTIKRKNKTFTINRTVVTARWNATAHVTEAQVMGDNKTPVTVTLTKTTDDKKENNGRNNSLGNVGVHRALLRAVRPVDSGWLVRKNSRD